MGPLGFREDDDDRRRRPVVNTRRRARSVSSGADDNGADERGTLSSSESEAASPRRRRRHLSAGVAQGVAFRPTLPAPLSLVDQQRLQEQIRLQDQLRRQHAASRPDESLVVRRPSLPTPRHSCDDDDDDLDDSPRPPRRRPRDAATPPPREPVWRRNDPSWRDPRAPVAKGKYKPHLVVVSLVDTVVNAATGDPEGKLLHATALDDHSFSGAGGENAGCDIVTSVKLSPSASLVLLGHSRGGDGTAGDGVPRVVSVIYRVGDMAKVDTRKEVGDDVNIARFHPDSGAGIVYGTKQGRICKITPLPPRSPVAAATKP